MYVGIVPTALGSVLFTAGVRRVPPTAAAVATMLEPLTAAALAAVWFGERLEAGGAIGAALLLGAVTAHYRDSGSR